MAACAGILGGRGWYPKARAALVCGFGETGFGEVVSFTAPAKEASIRVIQKIGMQHSPRDYFDHPVLAVGERLATHVLYRITAQEIHSPEPITGAHDEQD